MVLGQRWCHVPPAAAFVQMAAGQIKEGYQFSWKERWDHGNKPTSAELLLLPHLPRTFTLLWQGGDKRTVKKTWGIIRGMPTGFSSAINTFPSPNTRDKGASLAFYNSSPTSSGDLPVATVGPSPALQLHPAPVQPPDQSLGVTQEQPRQVCAWFGELSQGTAGWVDPCAAGEGANGSRRLGDGIGPSLLPLWQAECLQPCSSGTPAHVTPAQAVPNTPTAQLSWGNSGWKENKPLGTENAACSKSEPAAAAATSISRGGSMQLVCARHWHCCVASGEQLLLLLC